MNSDDARKLDTAITVAVSTMVEALGMMAENDFKQRTEDHTPYGEAQFVELLDRNKCNMGAVRDRWMGSITEDPQDKVRCVDCEHFDLDAIGRDGYCASHEGGITGVESKELIPCLEFKPKQDREST